MSSEPFSDALKETRATWKKYVTGLCILDLGVVIDWLSGRSFFSGEKPIVLADFKVVREALSASYGVLFVIFIITVFYESRVLRDLGEKSHESAPGASPAMEKARLWLLSPFSRFRLLRVVFWGLFVHGFLTLALFSLFHLAGWLPPRPERMSLQLYRWIGVGDLLALLLLLKPAWVIYKNFQRIRLMMEPVD